MDERGLPPRADYVQQMANLLQKRLNSNQTVGKRWVLNFVRRHQALKSRYNRKYDYQRAKCEDPTIIRDWFRLVRNIIENYPRSSRGFRGSFIWIRTILSIQNLDPANKTPD